MKTIVVFLFFINFRAYCQTIDYRPLNVVPKGLIHEAWMKDLFMQDQLIFIKNYALFFNDLLKSFPNNHELILDLQTKYSPPDVNKVGFLLSFHEPVSHFGFIELSNDLLNKIPIKMLNYIQKYELSIGSGSPTIKAQSHQDLLKKIDSWDIPQINKKKFKSQILEMDNDFVIPITRANWQRLPKEIRNKIINDFTDTKGIEKKGLQAIVTIENEDELERVIKQYSEYGKQSALKRYLLKLLKNKNGYPLSIKLEKILPPFLRKQINQFALEGGPNCYNSGLCVNKGNHYKREYTDYGGLEERLKKDYSLLTNTDSLNMGDIIAYTDKNGVISHVATYINEDIVFTKNGINKFNPYIFQRTEDVEEVYKDYFFKKVFYRKNSNNAHIHKIKTPEVNKCLARTLNSLL